MAKYRITAPDGRKFVITGGDTPPTQEQIQSLIAGYKEPAKAPVLTPLSDDMKAKPRDDYYHDFGKNFAIGLGQGAVSTLGRIANGMTLGGTDWLDRKLGGNLKRLDEDLQRSAEREGLGGLNKVAKFTTELGGNALGLGGKLVGGLAKGSSALAKSNLGKKIGAKALTDLPLVATASGLEGAIQGATASDKLRDLPQNVLTGGISGAVMPVAFKGLGYGIKNIAKPFTPSLMTEGMQGGLSNVVNNPDAVKLLNRGIKQSDDIANDFLLQSRPTARGINKETANMIDDALTSRINVPEAIKNANARYGQYMDVHGRDRVFIPKNALQEGLNPFQSKSLKQAIARGKDRLEKGSTPGSVDHFNKIKQDINAQIGDLANKPKREGDVRLLEILKHKVDDFAPEGLKRVDKGYEKAKRLEDAFERGKHYNPNNVDGSDYIGELPPFEQNAFAQGLFKRINNNSLSNKNLANTALGYENTLASVLRGDRYDDLIKGLNKQSTRFERLTGLGRKAESKLNTPEAQRFFGREQLESKGSMIGSALDWANSVARGKILTKASKNLLNPYYTGELGTIAKGISSANTLADYLIKNNPILGAGLSATAVNNMLNQ